MKLFRFAPKPYTLALLGNFHMVWVRIPYVDTQDPMGSYDLSVVLPSLA